MALEIGYVEAIFRYPVKSMRGEALNAATLGWHGFEGDRRLALRRLNDRGGFPWLNASRFPGLLLYAPCRHGLGSDGDLPTHILTPDRDELPVFSEELVSEVERRSGARVEMMHLKDGIFDDANVSVISSETVREIGRLAGFSLDARRFRPNIVVRPLRSEPFQESEWLGGILSFGDASGATAISVTINDVRCSTVNFDPDSAKSAPEVLKAIVRVNQTMPESMERSFAPVE